MQIWSLRIWRRRLFARTAWNGCRRGRFKRERALRRERERRRKRRIERFFERSSARTRAHESKIALKIQSHKNRREKERSVSFLAPKKNIYTKRERFESAPGTPRRDPQNRNRTTASRERRIERRTARVATVDDKANICFELCACVKCYALFLLFDGIFNFSFFFDTPPPPPLFFFNQPRDPKHISSLSFTFFN